MLDSYEQRTAECVLHSITDLSVFFSDHDFKGMLESLEDLVAELKTIRETFQEVAWESWSSGYLCSLVDAYTFLLETDPDAAEAFKKHFGESNAAREEVVFISCCEEIAEEARS